jgi:hypothetical protein
MVISGLRKAQADNDGNEFGNAIKDRPADDHSRPDLLFDQASPSASASE